MIPGSDGDRSEVKEEEDDDDDASPASAAGVALPPWLKLLNPNSCTLEHAMVEPSLAKGAGKPKMGDNRPAYQFQRVGFFCVDDTSTAKKPVFNRIVALREDKEKGAAKK